MTRSESLASRLRPASAHSIRVARACGAPIPGVARRLQATQRLGSVPVRLRGFTERGRAAMRVAIRNRRGRATPRHARLHTPVAYTLHAGMRSGSRTPGPLGRGPRTAAARRAGRGARRAGEGRGARMCDSSGKVDNFIDFYATGARKVHARTPTLLPRVGPESQGDAKGDSTGSGAFGAFGTFGHLRDSLRPATSHPLNHHAATSAFCG